MRNREKIIIYSLLYILGFLCYTIGAVSTTFLLSNNVLAEYASFAMVLLVCVIFGYAVCQHLEQ